MYAFKSAVLLAVFSACASLAAAAEPPACLLAAINTEPNPADLSTICGSDATKVEAQIQSLCSGSNVKAAMQAFSSTCSAAGKTVPTAVSASGSAAATSGTGSVTTGTASAEVTATHNSTLMYTSTYFDTSCSCTMTTAVSTAVAIISTGFASVTNSAMIPTTALGSATATQTGSAPSVRIGSCAALLVGVAAFFVTL